MAAEPRTVVKAVKNAKLYSDGTILIQDVRISHPHLHEKWAKKPTDTKAWSATHVLANATHAEAQALVREFCQDMLKERNKGAAIKADGWFFRDGNQSGKPEYADSWIIAARETDNKPVLLNPDKSEMALEDVKPTFKAGHRTDVLVEPWWQDNEHGKRINASLRAVRYRREDEAFSQTATLDKDAAISSFDDDDEGGFGGPVDDGMGGL